MIVNKTDKAFYKNLLDINFCDSPDKTIIKFRWRNIGN